MFGLKEVAVLAIGAGMFRIPLRIAAQVFGDAHISKCVVVLLMPGGTKHYVLVVLAAKYGFMWPRAAGCWVARRFSNLKLSIGEQLTEMARRILLTSLQ
jgi:hypothetical protein